MWKNKLSFLYSVRKFDVFFNRPGIIKNWSLIKKPGSFFHVLYNNFFYVLLSFVFHLQKDFYGVLDDTDAFFFFFFRKMLISFTSLFLRFVFFLLLKDFDTFHVPRFDTFLCFSDNIQLTFLYMWKRYLINFLHTQKHLK